MSDINVRSIRYADLPRVLTIQRMSFGAPLDNARSLERFIMRERGPKFLHVECPTLAGLVAEVSGNVVGFVLFQVDWPQGTATVLRLAVLPQYRRRCVGSRLLCSMQLCVDHMQMHLARQGYDIPDLDFLMYVPESDLNCQLFLRAKSFQCVRILKVTEADTGDVYLFKYTGVPRTPSIPSCR